MKHSKKMLQYWWQFWNKKTSDLSKGQVFYYSKRCGKLWSSIEMQFFMEQKNPEKCIDLSPVFPYCVEEKTPLLFPRIMIIYQIKISLTVCSKTNHYAKQSIYNYHYYHNRYKCLKRIRLVQILLFNFTKKK